MDTPLELGDQPLFDTFDHLGIGIDPIVPVYRVLR